MTFNLAVAGPSRYAVIGLPAAARPCLLRVRYASVAATSSPDESEHEDADLATEKKRAKALWASEEGYNRFKTTVAPQFASVTKGQKAKWLGGSMPFASNPSFRPPPPLSNATQQLLYDELQAGTTVPQLSHRYNISKARIEAVRKLKQVEEEFVRQEIPIQTSFLDGMESLLGVEAIQKGSTVFDPSRSLKDQTGSVDESTAIELSEEARWAAHIGDGGAFGDRIATERAEGIERTVWEFRSEEAELAERNVAREAAKDKANERAEARQVSSETQSPPPSAASSKSIPVKTADASPASSVYSFNEVKGRWHNESSRRRGRK